MNSRDTDMILQGWIKCGHPGDPVFLFGRCVWEKKWSKTSRRFAQELVVLFNKVAVLLFSFPKPAIRRLYAAHSEANTLLSLTTERLQAPEKLI